MVPTWFGHPPSDSTKLDHLRGAVSSSDQKVKRIGDRQTQSCEQNKREKRHLSCRQAHKHDSWTQHHQGQGIAQQQRRARRTNQRNTRHSHNRQCRRINPLDQRAINFLDQRRINWLDQSGAHVKKVSQPQLSGEQSSLLYLANNF